MSMPSSRNLPPRPNARRGSRAGGGEREGIDPAIIEALPNAVVVLDARGVVVAASLALAQMLGNDGPIAPGTRFFDHVGKEGAFASLDQDVCALFAGEARESTREIDLPGEIPRKVVALLRLVGEGKGAHVMLSLDDVSAARDEARDREMNQSFLLHDLKSPLWSVLINLPLALSALPPGEAREAIEDSIVEAERLRRMLNNLQDLHRSDNGALPLRKTRVNVVAIAQAAVDTASRAADIQGIEIEIESPPWLEVEVDETLVRRVLDNLIGNALRFAKTTVRVTLEEGPPFVLRVSDDGPGLPAAERERIFERFARAKNPSGRGDNAGLGLTFCRVVARRHGGDIRVDEAEGGGAEFVVQLG